MGGSHVAFETVHNMYKARLAYYVKKMLDDWQDVEDIVSETFMSLWKSGENIQSDLHLKNFLYITARNNALNHIKSKNRKSKVINRRVFAKIDVCSRKLGFCYVSLSV